jgi:hypothetical protein
MSMLEEVTPFMLHFNHNFPAVENSSGIEVTIVKFNLLQGCLRRDFIPVPTD